MEEAKIGEALYDLLSKQIDLETLHEGRVTPVTFGQGENFSALYYNTKGLKRLACRTPDGTKQGLLEIGLVAKNSIELETLADTVNDVLDGYEGNHLGYQISLEINDDDFDETDPDLEAFYKRLFFDLTVTKL
ncbi:hypothetical protein [Spirosoma endbachense]|uniref:DUF3168 domain-containing protein n=1 Tax=Spirosoma endbachense TaxID=2666025 RepID=A0A6P1VUJ0_9BACT|nr:hypothetical protein [Spirosoma endbachense]QHV96294.1 hypothetical protein GJR95_15275 [Spirosoma endbachense]